MPAQDSLKQRIHKGEVVIGVSAPITADRQRLEDILSRDSYDFVSVDSQHAAFNEEKLVQFCAIAEELDIPVQFRIKHTRHAYLIGNLLDLGPSGVEVPQVEDEATVDEALAYFYYPQFGNRSWGGAARRGIQGRDDRRAYAEWWHNSGVLWLQIESIEAITKARKPCQAERGLPLLRSVGPELQPRSASRAPVQERGRLCPPGGAATAGQSNQGVLQELHVRLAQRVHQHGCDSITGASQVARQEDSGAGVLPGVCS